VLAIGGLKEKLLGAKRAGVRKVLVPPLTKKTWMRFRRRSRAGCRLSTSTNLDDVLKHVFAGPEPRGRAAGPHTPRAKAASVKPARPAR